MATQANRKRAFEPPQIPDRLYFKIGDVAHLCGVETYVLRFWESQFPQLRPNKSGTGQRLYRRRDVELALEIKRLVHAQGYTLSGARTVLEKGSAELRSATIRRAACPLPPIRRGEWTRLARPSAMRGRSCARLPICSDLPQLQPARRRSRLAPIRAASGSLFPS